MGSRLFQFRYSNERDLQDIMLKVSIGASGAPTIVLGKGIVSMTRTGTGAYTLVLKDISNKLMHMSMVSLSGASAPTAPIMNIVSEAVNSASPNIHIQLRDLTGAAADAANGEVLMISITVRNAST
jgi:hypothetical protein